MARISRYEQWRRWKGTSADVAGVARRATELIDAGQNRDVACTISAHAQNEDEEFDGAEGFNQGISELGFERLRRLTVDVYDRDALQRVGVSISLSPYSGCELTVRGRDRVAVDGVFAQLKELLETGRRRYRDLGMIAWSMLCSGVTLSFVGGGSLASGIDDIRTVSGVQLSVSALLLLSAGVTYYFARNAPDLEFLPPDGVSRLDVALGKARRFGIWLAAAVVVAAIGFAADRLL